MNGTAGLDFPDDYPDKAWINNGSNAVQTEDWIRIITDKDTKWDMAEADGNTPLISLFYDTNCFYSVDITDRCRNLGEL